MTIINLTTFAKAPQSKFLLGIRLGIKVINLLQLRINEDDHQSLGRPNQTQDESYKYIFCDIFYRFGNENRISK